MSDIFYIKSTGSAVVWTEFFLNQIICDNKLIRSAIFREVLFRYIFFYGLAKYAKSNKVIYSN